MTPQCSSRPSPKIYKCKSNQIHYRPSGETTRSLLDKREYCKFSQTFDYYYIWPETTGHFLPNWGLVFQRDVAEARHCPISGKILSNLTFRRVLIWVFCLNCLKLQNSTKTVHVKITNCSMKWDNFLNSYFSVLAFCFLVNKVRYNFQNQGRHWLSKFNGIRIFPSLAFLRPIHICAKSIAEPLLNRCLRIHILPFQKSSGKNKVEW